MGAYWDSIWRRLARETGRVDWGAFRSNPEMMKHIENPTTARVLEVARRCVEDFGVPVALMKDSLVGAPPGVVNFRGVPVTKASVEHARMAWAVRRALPESGGQRRNRKVVEIGGGFGGLAWALCRTIRADAYTLIDHPAVLRIQTKFLDGIIEELETTRSCPVKGFRLVRPDEYEKTVPASSVDVVLNTRSMMEMDQSEINRYFGWIASVLSPDGIFYSVNRLEKVTRLNDWPWGLFEIVERRRWPEYIDRAPMDEIVAQRRTE